MNSGNDTQETICIEYQLDLKSWIKLNYLLVYRRPLMILNTLLGGYAFLMLISAIFLVEETNLLLQISLAVIVFILLFSMPLLVYSKTRIHFASNLMTQERITYTFSDNFVTIDGQSWNSRYTWDMVYKIREIKSWVLIYENNINVQAIPKDSFTEDQLERFIALVKSKPNLKHNFK